VTGLTLGWYRKADQVSAQHALLDVIRSRVELRSCQTCYIVLGTNTCSDAEIVKCVIEPDVLGESRHLGDHDRPRVVLWRTPSCLVVTTCEPHGEPLLGRALCWRGLRVQDDFVLFMDQKLFFLAFCLILTHKKYTPEKKQPISVTLDCTRSPFVKCAKKI
jgi:hypothetical protein